MNLIDEKRAIMQKELHIWLGDDYPFNRISFTLESTMKALHTNHIRVNTTQPHVCNTTWLVKGYRIFVHMLDGEIVEIKLGQCCDREIRITHNLEKLLLANCFGKATEEFE
jgi:hypothetical protein